ncbi:MAG: ABC transporter permease [Thermomicrobiales bacterium]|nr:ABC transporter permease [Thermomicrobiales bacterium]
MTSRTSTAESTAVAGEKRRITIGNVWATFGPLLSLIILSLLIWSQESVFMTSGNWTNIARQAALMAILGVGMTFVILTGGIDLSVGSILALSAVSGALLIDRHGWGMEAVLVTLGVGMLCGLINGLIITIGRIPPFIVTLGTMQIFRGVASEITAGEPISFLTASVPNFNIFGTRELGPFPAPVIIAFCTFVVGFLILRYTRLGLYVFAIGGNETATRFSGVQINRYKLAVYTFMGLCCGVAAVMLSSRLNSAKADFATGEELNAIAAVVIGGTSLFGGEGTLVGTMIGALLMAVIRNGLTLMHISAFYQQIVIGAVIILAVLVDQLRRRKS